jgi:small subunit ribosomal protein S20
VAKRNKSALKANRQNVVRREHNRALRSKLRTGLKSVRQAATSKDAGAAKQAMTNMQSLVDKMAAKGIIHKNTASRLKSRLSARVGRLRSA